MTQPSFQQIWPILMPFFSGEEGFSSKPYWDYKQWTWGYGSRVPGSLKDKSQKPNKTITPAQAMPEAQAEFIGDFGVLTKLVQLPLSVNQWVAYLDFAYNEGIGSAIKLLAEINQGPKANKALENHLKEYVFSGGKVNHDLVKRRDNEWNLWMKS